MGNLWIGPPGAMVEIDQAAKSFDRTADLGVSEYKSIGGRVTLARALDRIARRVDRPGPVFVVDPAAGNVLAAAQAAGYGVAGATGITGLAQWFKVTTGTVTENTSVPGTFLFTAADAGSSVAWRCTGTIGGFPASPGLQVSFRAPTAIAATGTASVSIDFKKADGAYLSSVTATGALVSGTVPANAAYLTPTAKPGTAGSHSLAGACLTYGSTAESGIPGDGLLPMSVTNYSDTPGRPLPYRNISLDLVEVSSPTS